MENSVPEPFQVPLAEEPSGLRADAEPSQCRVAVAPATVDGLLKVRRQEPDRTPRVPA